MELRKNKTNLRMLFCVTLVIVLILKCLNLSVVSEHIPYSIVYAGWIVFWAMGMIVSSGLKISKRVNPAMKLLLFLGVYYCIWGTYNIHNINYYDAFGNLIRSLLYVVFVIVSIYWIVKLDCRDGLIKMTYYAFSVYVLVFVIISIPQIDIIKSILSLFISDNSDRYRNYLGFSYPNLGAELAVSTIILSKVIGNKTKIELMVIKIINSIMILAAVINASRGSLLALILFEVIYFYIKNRHDKKSVKRLWVICLAVVAFVIASILYMCFVKGFTLLEILRGTNREAALAENILLLRNSKKWLMGIGRLTGGFFSSKAIVYGAQTGYLEVYYFEIFITSGIIGSIYMFSLIWSLVKRIVVISKIDNSFYSKWIFVVCIYMLFVSLFESYFFTYIYATSMLFNILIFGYISQSWREYGYDFKK